MQMQMQMQILPQVSFCQAIKLAFKNYAKCSGRSRRSEFWFFYLFIYGSNIVFIFALSLIMSIIVPYSSGFSSDPLINIGQISLIWALSFSFMLLRVVYTVYKSMPFIF